MSRLIWVILIFSLYSCTQYREWNCKRICKKFNYTQPHQSYSDKYTKRRAIKVVGHAPHRSY